MPNGFTVNVHRFDPYKNFRFQLMLDGRVVMGVSKMGALKRTTEVVSYRSGGGNTSWNSAHPSRGCSQDALRSTGGNGYFYCFAAD